jgi:radical SAM superfamily enzyme YgiQ (UPF0313 family)
VRSTVRWLRRARPDSVQFAYFVPYPGTPLFSELQKSRELGDLDAIEWESLGSFTGPVLPTRHLTKWQVARARNRLTLWQMTLAERMTNLLRRMIGFAPPAPT